MSWWRWLVVVCLLAGAGVLATAAPACACSCALVTPEEAFANADAVFVGVVEEIDEPWRGMFYSSADPVTVTFAVSDVYKGAVPANARLVTERDGASCGYEFAHGGRYLVHVHVRTDGEWRTSLCSGNSVLAQSGPVPATALPTEVVRSGPYRPGPAIDYPRDWPLPLVLFGGLGALIAVGGALLLRRRRRHARTKIGSSPGTAEQGAP
jgi:hypothetical protein